VDIDLTLHQWADIAQYAIAIAAYLALLGALTQILLSRADARRTRAYEYSDRFNKPSMRRRAARYREYFEDKPHSYKDFKKEKRVKRNELMLLPNVIEEVAALYHRKLIDRDVAAETLGPYVENLWEASLPFVSALRAERPGTFCDWEEMQRDTPGRRLKANEKIARRRLRRKLLGRD
jgi:hypothetical protein